MTDIPSPPPLSPEESKLVDKLARSGRLRMLGLPVDTINEMYELEADWHRIVRRMKLLDELVKLT